MNGPMACSEPVFSGEHYASSTWTKNKLLISHAIKPKSEGDSEKKQQNMTISRETSTQRDF